MLQFRPSIPLGLHRATLGSFVREQFRHAGFRYHTLCFHRPTWLASAKANSGCPKKDATSLVRKSVVVPKILSRYYRTGPIDRVSPNLIARSPSDRTNPTPDPSEKSIFKLSPPTCSQRFEEGRRKAAAPMGLPSGSIVKPGGHSAPPHTVEGACDQRRPPPAKNALAGRLG